MLFLSLLRRQAFDFLPVAEDRTLATVVHLVWGTLPSASWTRLWLYGSTKTSGGDGLLRQRRGAARSEHDQECCAWQRGCVAVGRPESEVLLSISGT